MTTIAQRILDLLAVKHDLPRGDRSGAFARLARASVALHLGDKTEARRLALEALNLVGEEPARPVQAIGLARIGVLLEQIRPGDGLSQLSRSLALLQEQPDWQGVAAWLAAASLIGERDLVDDGKAMRMLSALEPEDRASVLAVGAEDLCALSLESQGLGIARDLLLDDDLDINTLASACYAIDKLSHGCVAQADGRRVLELVISSPTIAIDSGLPEPVLRGLAAAGQDGPAQLLGLAHEETEPLSLALRTIAIQLLARLEDRENGRRELRSLLEDLDMSVERLDEPEGTLRGWASEELLAEVVRLVPVFEPPDHAVELLRRIAHRALGESSMLRETILATCFEATTRLDDAGVALDYVVGVLDALRGRGMALPNEVIWAAIEALAATGDARARPVVQDLAAEAARSVRDHDGDPLPWAYSAVAGWSALLALGGDGAALLDNVIGVLSDLHERDRLLVMERLLVAGRALDLERRIELLERLPLPLPDCCGECVVEDTSRHVRKVLQAIESLFFGQ